MVVVMVVVGLQLQMSLVGALFFDVVCGYALLAAAATHTCLFFCSDPFSTHTDTHIHTHTYTRLSTDHAAFTSEKIISVVTHSILLHDAHIHLWSDITCTIKTRPLRKGTLLLHQGLFLLPRPVLALETEHVPTLGCPETRNNQRHLRASRTMCTSSSPFRFGLRVPISG